MARELRVFGWYGRRPTAPAPHGQTREIVAAESKAQARRLSGHTGDMTPTGNADELRIATTRPGVVFWKGINEPTETGPWRAVDPRQ